MLISVKILKGGECNIEVTGQETVNSIKRIVEQELQIPADQQKLVFRGKTMMDDDLLCDYQVVSGNRVHCFVKQDLEKIIPDDCVITEIAQPDDQVIDSDNVQNPNPDEQSLVENVDSEDIFVMMRFYERLEEFLLKHFTPEDAEKVYDEFEKVLDHNLQHLNLEDVENLAASLEMQSGIFYTPSESPTEELPPMET